ncbi:esterase family protein [Stieleria sp. TO1_6]|uniref:alpha/beta hydrolase n=1 Tax=Stieleria tagensis TaxID=2956795 RepID=UPI00209A759F|nr:alpha/beta hydrolase-fold protein [Stieleria tagensis]MCO8120751.1 esterase family protein [Stieleria tagensis]
MYCSDDPGTSVESAAAIWFQLEYLASPRANLLIVNHFMLHRVFFPVLALMVFGVVATAQQADRKTSPSVSKSKPTEPSIVWANPPTANELPLPDGTSHRTFHSELVDQDVGYVIYLPPQYDQQSQTRYPVIYNLHGNGGNELKSLNVIRVLHDQITSGKIPPLVMVLANGGHSTFYKNSHDGRFPIESIVINELIPHVDANYRTIATGKGRCIEGFSMGGRGATRLAVKHPELFCSLFCQAGNVPHLLDTYDQLTPAERAQHLLGPDRENWQSDDVYAVTTKNKDRIKQHLRIQIACGTKDGGHLPSIRDFHQHLVQEGIDHTYIELQGLKHQRTVMIEQLKPIWFESHLQALRDAGSLQTASPTETVTDGS